MAQTEAIPSPIFSACLILTAPFRLIIVVKMEEHILISKVLRRANGREEVEKSGDMAKVMI